ncbi:MAG: preprotein translocase subunit SecG [bacterium]|nr:preprotein translocase subunit SecG [bacterium]
MLGFLLSIVHVVVAVFLVLVVLLQTGKRADLAGAFGGGGSQTAFGTRGAATVLAKFTTAAAVLFMITSLSLSIVSVRNAGGVGGSVLEQVEDADAGSDAADEGAALPATPDAGAIDDPAAGTDAAPSEPSGEETTEDGGQNP